MNHLVGGGNPLWASVNYVGHCWELEWPFWTIFFAKCIFYMYQEAAKKIWLIFFGFYPLKKAFFLEGVAGWPDFQKWGAPLIFGKLHHKEIAFVFGRGTWLTTFPKLRGAPQFWKSAEYEVLCRWSSSTIMNRLCPNESKDNVGSSNIWMVNWSGSMMPSSAMMKIW